MQSNEETTNILNEIKSRTTSIIQTDEWAKLDLCLSADLLNDQSSDDCELQAFDIAPFLFHLQSALICINEMEPSRPIVVSLLLLQHVKSGTVSLDFVKETFGEDVCRIIHGLIRINEFSASNPSVETDNYRDMLLSMAEDMRVIFIIIAERVNLMRQIKELGTDEDRKRVAREASFMYVPIAHKLGLYLLKSEMEDLSLKYLNHDAFYMIKDKLSATKRTRDQYIHQFITPIEQRLQEAGLRFHVKGRTKSIHSIWQKMQKQKCPFEGIYDLFAIRIILDSAEDHEKQDCWQAYSIVTDMYMPNPKRLRDWLSVPKSNGYESLHTTVMGPEGKWVEIQIRTERMDDIAEHGLAAHWRYKGVKSSNMQLEDWLADIRTALESQLPAEDQITDQFKVDLYSDEVFVFTPKGDLHKLPKGATVLDFAFAIHTNVGAHCSGGKVNGKNVPMRTKLQTGDQVEILTNPNQLPKHDWLNYAITSKAKTKIRQAINEQELKSVNLAKEAIDRKFHNRKIEYSESVMMKTIKRFGYKYVNDFYKALGEDTIDANTVIDTYIEEQKRENNELPTAEVQSASTFKFDQTVESSIHKGGDDVLLIGRGDIKGVEYNLARCCNPIYGDPITGFVTISRGITIHRTDCPNCQHMKEGMGYRVIPVSWAEQANGQFMQNLRIVGNDDVGIVNNITSIILKEKDIVLRGIDIHSSEDGLFTGNLTIMIDSNTHLKQLINKLKLVKGVKNVSR